MPFSLGTSRIADYPTQQAINALVDYVNQMEAAFEDLKATVLAATPLTLPQVQAALSATGSNPLNVTGLPGTLTQNQPTKTP